MTIDKNNTENGNYSSICSPEIFKEKCLVAIEGLDGSGKATQSKLLSSNLSERGIKNRLVSFPDYDSESSRLVKMYLDGEIGTLDQVGAYPATCFFAADRYISFKTKWGSDYLRGDVIISDRYSTSNIIYQMAKLQKSDWESYLEWTWDFEFVKLGLPSPNIVIYLDVDPQISQKLMLERYHGDNEKKDIHESNLYYLYACREAALYSAKKLGWKIIDCTPNGEILPVNDIQNQIFPILYR